MATKVKIKGLKGNIKKVGKRAKKIANKALQDEKLANRFKNIMVNNIRKHGVMPDGDPVLGVSSKWIARRKLLSEYNKTSKYWTPQGSKLTFTGKFLTSFKARVVVSFFGKVRYIIGPTGSRPEYKTPKSEGIKETNRLNRELAKARAVMVRTKSGKLRNIGPKPKRIKGRNVKVNNSDIGKGQIKQGRDYTILGEDIKAAFRKAAIGKIRKAFKLELAKQGST